MKVLRGQGLTSKSPHSKTQFVQYVRSFPQNDLHLNVSTSAIHFSSLFRLHLNFTLNCEIYLYDIRFQSF